MYVFIYYIILLYLSWHVSCLLYFVWEPQARQRVVYLYFSNLPYFSPICQFRQTPLNMLSYIYINSVETSSRISRGLLTNRANR